MREFLDDHDAALTLGEALGFLQSEDDWDQQFGKRHDSDGAREALVGDVRDAVRFLVREDA